MWFTGISYDQLHHMSSYAISNGLFAIYFSCSICQLDLLVNIKLEIIIFQLNDAVFIKHFKMKQKIFSQTAIIKLQSVLIDTVAYV